MSLACIAWSSLYRAKIVTRLEFVEEKIIKWGKVFRKMNDFINWFLIFSQKKKILKFKVVVTAAQQ